MSRIWIGDFRSTALRAFNTVLLEDEDRYLIEDSAGCSWFNNIGKVQLGKNTASYESAIVMLGFKDCIDSFIYSSFSLKEAVKSFSETLNELAEQNKDMKLYVCSVCPVTSDYFTTLFDSGVIKKNDLNERIKEFNTLLRSSYETNYIDLYSYLEDTNFSTIDGVHFTEVTSACILHYINMIIKSSGVSIFVPRTTKPEYDPDSGYINLLWLGDNAYDSKGNRGLNPFTISAQPGLNRYVGDVLPNCTGYAWGRFYEILGSRPTLCKSYPGGTHHAEMWYLDTADGYKRGQEPALGAVACWRKGDLWSNDHDNYEAGHVAIVEAINEDGSITVSESGHGVASYWWMLPIKKDDANGEWYYGPDYHFQGFIYCPTITAVTKDEIRSKNDWSVFTVDDAMKKNAQYIWQYLSARNWSINAVAALLGNLQSESGMSPSIWESCIEGSIINTTTGIHTLNTPVLEQYFNESSSDPEKRRYPGYGLVQWTPYTKYTAWCTDPDDGRDLKYWDIDSQLDRIIWESDHDVWGLAPYNSNYKFRGKTFGDITFRDFIVSTDDVGWLAAAFAFCYEKPGSSTPSSGGRDELCRVRASQGEFWYKFLKSLPPITADGALRLENLKVDTYKSTSVTVSFLARGVNTASYILTGGSSKNTAKEININGDFTALNLTNLIPNTNYILEIVVKSSNESEIKKTLDFTTLQDYPETISEIQLIDGDTQLLSNNYKLAAIPTNPEFGYWKANGHGYTLQLIVNGSVKEKKEEESIPNFINIKEYFKYKVKVGDIIQIGIRTWVKYNGEKLYDSQAAKTSNTICMLKKPIIAYLNTD